MVFKAELLWIVVLRFLTVATLVASITVLVTNHFTDSDNSKTTFKDVITYRFVLAIAGIGVLYSLCQIPFAMYHVHKEKRLIRDEWAPEFDFYGDKIMSWLLSTSVGAGFAATYELKKALKRYIQFVSSDEVTPKRFKFLDRGYVAVGLLFIGFLCVAIVSILSSLTRTTTHKSKGFFG